VKDTWRRGKGGELFSDWRFDFSITEPPPVLTAGGVYELGGSGRAAVTGSRGLNWGIGFVADGIDLEECRVVVGKIGGTMQETAQLQCSLEVPDDPPDEFSISSFLGGTGLIATWEYKRQD